MNEQEKRILAKRTENNEHHVDQTEKKQTCRTKQEITNTPNKYKKKQRPLTNRKQPNNSNQQNTTKQLERTRINQHERKKQQPRFPCPLRGPVTSLR